jgi:hypothetical protein
MTSSASCRAAGAAPGPRDATRERRSYGGKQAALQFRKAGTNTYTAVRTVTANSAGDLRTTVAASADGYWRWSVGDDQHRGSRIPRVNVN